MKPPKIIGNSTRPLIPILEISANKPSAGTAPLPDAITASANNTPPATINGNICEVPNKRWPFMVLRSFLKLLLLLVA
ncbi:Uncharacterised protein [Vibrio cholerae]|nr:Uncharacterised protein [Vibrio cholerae]